MAKKSKRAKTKHQVRVTNKAQIERSRQPDSLPAEVSSPTPVSSKVQSSKAQDLSNRYQYVIPEMKHIGIIAGIIIVILIVLSFILG